MINMVKLPTNKSSLFLRVAKGHFATSHSHINYYIDVTTQKSRLSEAKAVAKELVATYQHSTIVDTVLCLDGTQVIGTCLANELTKDGFANMNAHQTIYVITPEYTTGSQIILRDNLAPMVKGKHVLILAASITTGSPHRLPSRLSTTTAARSRACRPSSPPPPTAWASRSRPSSTRPTCPTTPASIPATAPCARRASASTPSSTASAIPPCKLPPSSSSAPPHRTRSCSHAAGFSVHKNAPGGPFAALRGHSVCVVLWRTRPALYSIAIRFGFSGKAFVC